MIICLCDFEKLQSFNHQEQEVCTLHYLVNQEDRAVGDGPCCKQVTPSKYVSIQIALCGSYHKQAKLRYCHDMKLTGSLVWAFCLYSCDYSGVILAQLW